MNKRVIAVLSAGTFSVLSFLSGTSVFAEEAENVTIEFMYYADYTEVETMPKLFIKSNSHKSCQISFSA